MAPGRGFWIPVAIFAASAAADDALTYYYVKLMGLYEEANPVIAGILASVGDPLHLACTLALREAMGILVAALASLAYRGLIIALSGKISAREAKSPSRRILEAMRRAWTWPLWLASIIRLMPVIHNALLIFFGVESPLSWLVRRMFSSFGGSRRPRGPGDAPDVSSAPPGGRLNLNAILISQYRLAANRASHGICWAENA